MTKKNDKTKELNDILQSVSDVLFPDALGKKKVEINSRDSDGDTPLHVIARRNDFKGVILLINAGADVNAIGDMGETPLHAALTRKNTEIVEALLQAGADPDISSEFGETARDKVRKIGCEFRKIIQKYSNT